MTRTVLMNAGPWLPVPPHGYGGIENVVATLIPELRRRGVRVWLCGVAGSHIEVDRFIPTFEQPMFGELGRPYTVAMGIAHAHMLEVVRVLREAAGAIDLVHDHLEVVGPSVLAALGDAAPPVLQTLHWDLRKHPDFYGRFDGAGRIFFNAVSRPQLTTAPARLQAQTLDAIPLATQVHEMPFGREKWDRFLVLARITNAKGQDVAARLCQRHGWGCDLAGPVGPAADAARLEAGLADPVSPLHAHPDRRYWAESVRPHVDGRRVRWLGTLGGAPKLNLLARPRAAVPHRVGRAGRHQRGRRARLRHAGDRDAPRRADRVPQRGLMRRG